MEDWLQRWDSRSSSFASPSVSPEFRVYTLSGALLSVATVFLIVALVVSEALFCFHISQEEQVYVNSTNNDPKGLEVELDVTFKNLACHYLQVDAQDVHQQDVSMHLDRHHRIWKHRLKFYNGEDSGSNQRVMLMGMSQSQLERGSWLRDNPSLEFEKQTENESNITEEDCGDCYGAGEEGECCNTCDDVERAHYRLGRLIQHRKWHQCLGLAQHEKEDDEDDTLSSSSSVQYGCNIHVVVALNTGGGKLLIRPIRLAVAEDPSDTKSILAGILKRTRQANAWNVSHHIHKLRFSTSSNSISMLAKSSEMSLMSPPSQLEGETRIMKADESNGVYQYFVSVVPTTYRFLNGSQVQVHQYSVTEHLRKPVAAVSSKKKQQLSTLFVSKLDGGMISRRNPTNNSDNKEEKAQEGTVSFDDTGAAESQDSSLLKEFAGVYFIYEVSPLHAEITERYQKGWVEFFTSLCAVVGGAVTLVGMLDQYLFRRLQSQIPTTAALLVNC